MRKYYLLYFKFLTKYIIHNKFKFLFLIFTIMVGFKLESHERIERNTFVISSFEYEKEFFYVINSKKKKEIISFKEPKKIIDDKITYTERNEINDFLIGVFTVSCIIWLILIGVSYEDEEIWQKYKVITKCVKSLIYIEEQEGVFYYMIYDRLILKSNNLIDKDNVYRTSDISNINDILSLPKFKTKKQKRENIFTLLDI
jgi:hypothetical protein